MLRPIHRVAGSFRVTFSPEAWRLIGSMPSALFQSLQHALERLANSPSRGALEVATPLSATLDELTVIYELNEAARTLTVVNLLRARA